MDSDFKNLFKIKVEWEDSAEFNAENVNRLARIIHDYCIQAELLQLDKYAMAKVVEYASRLAGDQTKISTLFNDIFEVIGEASTWAKMSKSKIITTNFIEKALKEQKERVKKYDSMYTDMIKDNSLLISTSGSKVGELNGLTVMTIGNAMFGKPAKITVNTYTGKNGIVDIEREVEMSGSTHSKGVLILNGFLGERFAQDIPLSLTASICFEQLYNGVDGDSASSTELYGLLSSLSGVPISQSIAVTGSVNQKGEIQPIGGVNEKIEGFYQICKMRGLDGSHGVMIPIQNVKNLQLSDEVIDSVRNGLFTIYAISTIDEGIEILTGVPAGKKDKDGNKDIFLSPSGFPGIDLRLPLMITEGLKRGVSLEKIVELLSVNPAKLFHIFPQKGTISAGADGDLVIVDMNKKVTCHAEDSYSQAKGIMKVYEGWQLDCAVDSTIVRGRVVYENGKVDESASGWGEFVKPVLKK